MDIKLSDYGEESKKLITKEINWLETNLPKLMDEQPEEAMKIVQLIGGNIFLLKGFDYELLKQFDKARISTISDEVTDFFWYDTFATIGDSVEGAFDAFDAFGSSGCSGGSGCSSAGCSGCGGCGGCS